MESPETIASTTRYGLYGLLAFLGLPISHALWMALDWALRDPNSPAMGGISQNLTSGFQVGSLAIFTVLVFLSLGRIEMIFLRLFLSSLCTALAFVTLVFAWLYYIVGNGIDTL